MSSSLSTSPLWSHLVFPTYLPIFSAHSLYAAILANPIILRVIEDLPLFCEDLISQELVRLFHNVSAIQQYHALAALQDLPEDFGIPLRMTIAHLPNRILSILYLHGFHSFVEQILPTIRYPAFQRIVLSMTMEQRDSYLSQSELPPHRSLSPLPVPAPHSPTLSLLTWLSSPALSNASFSLTAVNPEYGLDEDALARSQSFVVRISKNCLVISAPTCLLNVLITHQPTSLLTECFRCSGRGHYREDCSQYICPYCNVSAPRHPQTSCLSIQCDFCSCWEHSDRFCPTRICNLCDQGGHITNDCPTNVLSRSRLPISLGLPPRSNWNIPYGVLIEPGVRLYEGGNVMVCLLANSVFLFSFYRRTHHLFGMFSYNWIHCLLLFDSSNTVLIELWLHAVLFYSSLISIYLSVDSLLPSIQFCCIGYMSWLTHNLPTCSMMFYAYVYSSISSLPHIPYSSFLIYAI